MLDFDIILGMDMLYKWYATIDYRNRVVRFQFPNELVLKWEGRGSNPRSKIVSNLKENKMLSKGLGADKNLSYEEVSVAVLDCQVKRLRNKEVSTAKVLWRNHVVEGATWEDEADMRSLYPHLFSS